MSVSKDLVDVIKASNDKETKGYDTQATVTRVEDSTVWVHIPGGVDETPVKKTVNAKEGDIVQVRVSGGSAWLMGNASSPPTDDTTAFLATQYARTANAAAESAVQSAKTAGEAAAEAYSNAESAKTSAEQAKEEAEEVSGHLKSVVQGATTVEKAVSVMQTALEAITEYDPETDKVQEYFWHDANGSHVLGDTSGYRNDISSSGMDIVEVASEKSVAEFGADGARIGFEDSAYAALSATDFEIKNEENTFFRIKAKPCRSATTSTYTYHLAPGETSVVIHHPVMHVASVACDDVSLIEGRDYKREGNTIILTESSEEKRIIDIAYYTYTNAGSEIYAQLGIADTAEKPGVFSTTEGALCAATNYCSHAEGEESVASGASSHAEGRDSLATAEASHAEGRSKASGKASHAEGGFLGNTWDYTRAEGASSHAEGYRTKAKGDCSHAQNIGTTAASEGQTALGKYNESDYDGKYAVIIGNGKEADYSNALAVRWDGVPEFRNPAGTFASVFDLIYPVGSIYMSVNNVSPANLFGGTWESIQDRFLLAAGTSYSAGSTGGSADASLPAHTHTVSGTAASAGAHTHTVSGTAASNGAHTHSMKEIWSDGSGKESAYTMQSSRTRTTRSTASAGAHTHSVSGTAASNGAHTHSVSGTAASAGVAAAGKNMPPYLTVYMWKRTA